MRWPLPLCSLISWHEADSLAAPKSLSGLCLHWNWQEINPTLIYKTLSLTSLRFVPSSCHTPPPGGKRSILDRAQGWGQHCALSEEAPGPTGTLIISISQFHFQLTVHICQAPKHIYDSEENNRIKTGMSPQNIWGAKYIFNCSTC